MTSWDPLTMLILLNCVERTVSKSLILDYHDSKTTKIKNNFYWLKSKN